MKEMYNNYKNKIKSKNSLIILVFIVFIIGLIFGSIYITILSNNEKSLVINKITNYYSYMKNIHMDDKIDIFKNSLYSNISYTLSMWLLGLSIVGLPIIFIMVFFKSFILGFSVSGIFAKYKFKGLLKIFIYIFPSKIVSVLYMFILATYSIYISVKILNRAIKKENLNFKMFMGKYFFILVIGILIDILCSLYDGFVDPFIYKIFK